MYMQQQLQKTEIKVFRIYTLSYVVSWYISAKIKYGFCALLSAVYQPFQCLLFTLILMRLQCMHGLVKQFCLHNISRDYLSLAIDGLA